MGDKMIIMKSTILMTMITLILLFSATVFAQQSGGMTTQNQVLNKDVRIMVNSSVTGLTNAIMRVHNQERAQHLTQVMEKIQEHHRLKFQNMTNLQFQEEIDGKIYATGKVKAKFLNIIPMEKQLKYQINQEGNVEQVKGMFHFLWKYQDNDVIIS